MIEIIRILRMIEKKFINTFPSLNKHDVPPKWYEPKYVLEKGEEIENRQIVLLDYGLTQADTFIIFVEGKTELILLEEWLKFISRLSRVKVNLKELTGKRKAFMFKYLVKNFNATEYFLVLDQDTEEYARGKKEE